MSNIRDLHDKKMSVSFVPTRSSDSANILREEMTVSELYDFLQNASGVAEKRSGLMMKIARYDGNRDARGLGEIYALQADYDEGLIPVEVAENNLSKANVEAIIHTTFSHTKEAPRYRVIFPLSEPITKDSYDALMDIANGAFGGALAQESWVAAQNYYFQPSQGQQNEVRWVRGRKIDSCTDIKPVPKFENPYRATAEFNSIQSDDILSAILSDPEGVYPRMLTLTARWVYQGLTNAEIELMCKPIVEHIREARGEERAEQLHTEIGRLVWGARTKGFDDNSRSFEQIASEKPNRLNIAFSSADQHYRHHPDILVEGYLYKDVGMTYGPGGVAKTTTLLYEHLLYAMGLPFDGHKPIRPLKTLFISAEDTNEMYLAKVNEFLQTLQVGRDQALQGRQNIGVIYTGDSPTPWRLTKVEKDTVVIDDRFKDELLTIKEEFPFDVVVFDPAVSFGVGEARVNDAEQGLITAARWLVGNCDCAVEFVHHTGKGKDRTGQYGYRGGSAFGDGARRVRSVEGWKGYVDEERDEFKSEFAIEMNQNQSGIRISTGKQTYNRGAMPTLILRDGFEFEVLDRETLMRDKIQADLQSKMESKSSKMPLYELLYDAIGKYNILTARFIKNNRKETIETLMQESPMWDGVSGAEVLRMFNDLTDWGCVRLDDNGPVCISRPSVDVMNIHASRSPEDDF